MLVAAAYADPWTRKRKGAHRGRILTQEALLKMSSQIHEFSVARANSGRWWSEWGMNVRLYAYRTC